MMLSAFRVRFGRLPVGLGLLWIGLHERVGERVGRRLSAPARRLAIARAVRRVQPLRRWEGIPDRTFARYTEGGNAVRIARVRDLVPAGRRILDIGIGHGYVAGVLLRDRRPSHYCGVDLREARTAATRAMIEANDLDDRPVELVVRNILEVDSDFWRHHDPEMVLLLEVLEHLSDPAAALRAIGAGVRPGTRVLFTVPLYGRLERIWGHRSVFDRRRLEWLCQHAGLVIERAQPLQSTWSLVLARKVSGSIEAPRGESVGYTFSQVPVRPGDARPDGGVRLRMPNPRVVRVELSVDPPGRARQLRIQGLDESGSPRVEWAGPADPGRRTTYVLRPGKPARSLAASPGGDVEAVAWIDVSAVPEPGTDLTLTVHRAAYVAARMPEVSASSMSQPARS
jgi:2-polyprenyl-3-methyl-5-hydroxy-6-metoxy-1,4-benzoquinol methylase